MRSILTISLALISSLVLADHHEEQVLPIVKNFNAADSDKNKALNTTEFKIFVKANAAAGLGRLPMIEERGVEDRVFSRMDSNDDGEIALEELMAMRR